MTEVVTVLLLLLAFPASAMYDYHYVLRDWGSCGNVSGSRGNICLTEFDSPRSEEFQERKAARD